MKQRYSHIQLLALRHECQEQSVKSFFATCRVACVFSDLQPNGNFPVPFSGLYADPHSRLSVRFSQGHQRRLSTNNPRTNVNGPAVLYPGASNATLKTDRSALKAETPPLESFQLVKIPSSLGELPPGSRIIKVRPGIPVPVNAIPISIAEVPVRGAANETETKKSETKPVVSSCRWTKNTWDVDYESPSYDGVSYFAAEDNGDQNHFSAVEDSGAANGTGTKVGPTTRASSETMASSETKFHYARFFEPYMRMFSGADGARKSAKQPASVEVVASAVITPSTSYESESATEYSSDSSNIQIQLPT